MRIQALLMSLLLGISVNISAQYVSGKMIPDQTATMKSDLKDKSYLLSTTITAKEMKEHLTILASDAFEGRETGEKGNDMAAQYLADQFNKLKLPKIGDRNGYYQSVSFTFSSWKTNEVSVNGEEYRQLWDFLGFPQTSQSANIDADEVIFAGYGIDEPGVYSDYANKNVKDAILLVYDGEPVDTIGKSRITGTDEMSKWSNDFEIKRDLAEKMGAKAILIISNDLKAVLNANRRILVNRVTELGDKSIQKAKHTNLIIISSTMAQSLLGDKTEAVIALRDQLKINGGQDIEHVKVPTELSINQEVEKTVLKGQNVAGFIEGTDLKDEIVVVSAHYDHVGTKGEEVYNGADDDGSGTTTVLEIAETLATAKKMKLGPRRSVLCLLVTGEEKGLLGSDYYTQNPLYPLDKTVVDVNIDMVGRWGEEYLDQDEPYVYVIGSDRLSSELHEINEEMNEKYTQIVLDYKYNDENDPNRFYFRSDHYNFAKNGIPSIFFFNGVHEDYHRLTDTVEKIDFDLMEARGRLIFHTLWNIANRDNRIMVDGAK